MMIITANSKQGVSAFFPFPVKNKDGKEHRGFIADCEDLTEAFSAMLDMTLSKIHGMDEEKMEDVIKFRIGV